MIPRIDQVALVTTDMAASLAFYRQLGLEVPEGADNEPHVEVALPGGLRMAWDDAAMVRSFDPEWEPATGGGLTPAFLCDGPEEVDRLYARLTAAGHPGKKAPWDAFWGQRYAVVLDPDGNAVDLFAPLAGNGPAAP